LDLEQLPAWLTRVALNLCADIGRDQRRHHKRVRYQVMHQPTELDAETVVVERVYARAMYDIAQELPAAQRAALLLKAEGHTIGEVAEALAISDKAAESLLSRARAAPRPALVAPRDVTVGPAGVHDGGEGWKHSDETLVQSARECVDQGVVITAQYVGCKAAQQSAPSAR